VQSKGMTGFKRVEDTAGAAAALLAKHKPNADILLQKHIPQ
jgi:hypothetical protein